MAQPDDITNHPAIAAAAGAFVSMVLARKMTPLQALVSWCSGFLCAWYGTSLLIGWLPWLLPYERGATFVVGVFGLQIVAVIYDVGVVLREDPKATLMAVVDILLKRKDLKP